MKNIYLTISALLYLHVSIGQTQIENGDFEQWENVNSDTEEPLQWSSLKTSTDDSWLNLANQAPQVVWKSTSNPHLGNACLYLKVAPFNNLVGIAPNAIVTNGRVFASTTPSDGYVYTNETDNNWNTNCTDKPDSLVGWFKYNPQSNDKGKVEILFHTNANEGFLPDNGTTNHWVGNGIVEFTSLQNTWKRFSFPLTYTSALTPNYFLMVITAGDETNAVENSELWIDDLSFIYNPAPVSIQENVTESKLTVINKDLKIEINTPFKPTNFKLFSIDGKEIWSNLLTESTLFTPNLNSGIYIYTYTINGKMYSGKVVF